MSELPATGENGKAIDYAEVFHLGDLVDALVSDAEETVRAAAEGRARGPIIGLQALDELLAGFLSPGIHTWTGDPGSGKTALALHAAAHCGTPCVYVTAEQSPVELFRRFVAAATRTPINTLRAAVPAKVRELCQEAAAKAPMLAFVDATRGAATKQQLYGLAAGARERFNSHGVLLVIDAFQPWSKGLELAEGRGEYDTTQEALRDLVHLTGSLDAPALVLSHRNRASTKEKQHNAAQTAAKGSADFEHMSETVLHLRPAKDEKGDYADEREVTCYVAKNRRGRSDVGVSLHFDGSLQTFRDSRSSAWVPNTQRTGGRW